MSYVLALVLLFGTVLADGLKIDLLATSSIGSLQTLVTNIVQRGHSTRIFVVPSQYEECSKIFGKLTCISLQLELGQGVFNNPESPENWISLEKDNRNLAELLLKQLPAHPPDIFVVDILAFGVDHVATTLKKPICFFVNAAELPLSFEPFFHTGTQVKYKGSMPESVQVLFRKFFTKRHVLLSRPFGRSSKPMCPNLHPIGLFEGSYAPKRVQESTCRALVNVNMNSLDEKHVIIWKNATRSFAHNYGGCVSWESGPHTVSFDAKSADLQVAACQEPSIINAIGAEVPFIGVAATPMQRGMCDYWKVSSFGMILHGSYTVDDAYHALQHAWLNHEFSTEVRRTMRYNRLLGGEQHAVTIVEYVSEVGLNDDFNCQFEQLLPYLSDYELPVLFLWGAVIAVFLFILRTVYLFGKLKRNL